jgi:cysteine desulfurase family protein (TIGR01976 family)
MSAFPIADVRAQFPSLQASDGFVFFDNAAGAQVPQSVIDAVHEHLLHRNVQRGGRYRRSMEVDAVIARARESVGLFVNAWSPDEIAFGMNATSFIRTVSLAIGQTLADRPEVVVSDLDHEANIATWLALEPYGARVRWWRIREDARLHVADLEPLLSSRTRLVACTLASNAVGSLVDITGVSRLAHAVGAEVFVDAVHYGPHGSVDVRRFGCDYLVCSGYKIFGPHMGFLWGRLETLAALPTFREHFIPDAPPGKLEAGTFVYENVAGMDAAVRYLEGLGRRLDASVGENRRLAIERAMSGIRDHEMRLSEALLGLADDVPGLTIHGLRETRQAGFRTPTLAFTLAGAPPEAITRGLADRNIGVRDGHMYAPRLIDRLGLSGQTGVVRASLVHYNSLDEVARFGDALRAMARPR